MKKYSLGVQREGYLESICVLILQLQYHLLNLVLLYLNDIYSWLIGVFNLICTTNLNEHFKLLKSSLKIKIYVIPGSRSEFKMRLMKFKHQGSDLSDPFQFQYIPLLQDVEKHKSCNC